MPKHAAAPPRCRPVAAFALWALLSAFLVVLVLPARVLEWGMDEWGGVALNEILFTLSAPLAGTESSVWQGLAVFCLPVVLGAAAVALAVLAATTRGTKARKAAVAACLFAAAVYLALSVSKAWGEFGVGDYLAGQSEESSFIEENYVDPSSVSVEFPGTKRNLVYIYLESMEVTYADKAHGGGFDDNYIPRLWQIAQENESFSDGSSPNGGYSLYNTTWTMGGMVAQTAGLPLSIPVGTNSMEWQDEFMPAATTLGDVLQANGYRNAFLLGSRVTFGGRKLYFSTHGDYEFYDYVYSKEQGQIPQDYNVWWGYEDAKLFEFAKEHLEDLADSGQPFNFTILTVDTHREDGYVCPDCPTTFGDNRYANVIACSDERVADFVDWLQDQEFYENTTVVLVGDHTTMDVDFCDPIDDAYDRRVYTCFLNAAQEPATHEQRQYSTMDMFPTTLAALGARIEGERLGLGTNLFSQERTLVERYGVDEANVQLARKSAFLDALMQADDLVEPRTSVQAGAGGGNVIVIEDPPHASKIRYLSFGVWQDEEGQSDLVWFPAQKEGEAYRVQVKEEDLRNGPGSYWVSAYLYYTDGTEGGLPSQEFVFR